MRRNRSDLAFLIGGCFLIPLAAIGQMRPTSDTAAMLASPTLPPEGRKAIQNRIDTVHARFRATHGGLGPEQFGVQCCQITQIHGSGFTTLGDPWIYQAFSYLYPDGGSSPMSAPVLLPSGVEIEFLDLYSYDSDPVNNIRAQLIAYSGGGPGSGSPGIDILTTTTSGGDSGYGYDFSPAFGLFYTVNNDVAFDPAGAQLSIQVFPEPAGYGDSDLRFRGVDLWWMRQVSPAPAIPTFNDVPASDPAFQFIEALAASGITVGCSESPPLYCPDAALTRRQMAVFLSKGLGLYWPD